MHEAQRAIYESAPYVAKMLLSSAKLPEPVKGRRNTSSETSGGIPKNEKTGDNICVSQSASPLALKRATAHKIAHM